MKYVIFLIFAIIILLLILPIKFRFRYSLFENQMYLNISFTYLLGLFSSEVNPLDKKDKNINKKPKDLKGFRNNIKEFDYIEVIKYSWDRLDIEKLFFKTTIGSDNPFISALLYGLLWNIIGIFTGYLSMSKNINDLDIDILSTFEKNCLNIEFDCIIKIKMVYIISIWIKLIKLYRGGVKNVKSSNRRIDASYNE